MTPGAHGDQGGRRPLTAASVVRHLLDRGLLNSEEVVERGVRAVPRSRRHATLLIMIGDGGGFAVKQAVPEWGAHPGRLDREAAVYRMAATLPALRAVLPACHQAEERDDLLILELIESGDTLLEHHHREAACRADLAAALGCALGSAHLALPCAQATATFPGRTPWVLDVLEPGGAEFAWRTPATADVLTTLPHRERLRESLRWARAQWRQDCVMHGDLKWDNCLLESGSAGERVKLIDWELADLGDPAWDLGGALQDYVAFAALSYPDPISRTRSATVGEVPLDRLRAPLGAFWEAYRGAAGLQSCALPALAQRSALFAGARLVQTALEHAAQSGPRAPAVAPLLDVALGLLEEPAQVAATASLGRAG